MKMLVRVNICQKAFNAALKDGSAGAKMKRILDDLKPEAVYFTEMNGRRTCIMIVNMADASKVPSIAEPWFLTFNAEVEFHIVMSPDDLGRAGLDELAKKWA